MNITDPITKLLNMVTGEKQELDDISNVVQREEKEIQVTVAATMSMILVGLVIVGKRYVWPYCKKRFTTNSEQNLESGTYNIQTQEVNLHANNVKIYKDYKDNISSNNHTQNDAQPGNDVIDQELISDANEPDTQRQMHSSRPSSIIDHVHNQEVPMRMSM